MTLARQSWGEAAFLSAASLAWLTLTLSLVMDFRGFLTSYAHRCWEGYQTPGFQRMFLLNRGARRFYADEAKVRRSFRATGVVGVVVGMFILGVEVAALVTGSVS